VANKAVKVNGCFTGAKTLLAVLAAAKTASESLFFTERTPFNMLSSVPVMLLLDSCNI
jgi:hypothetical protein